MKNTTTDYRNKKNEYDKFFTIYGRKVVLEALKNDRIEIIKIHLSESNKKAKILDDIVKLSKQKKIPVVLHDKLALSRISKNKKQDQGVAADLHLPMYLSDETFFKQYKNDEKDIFIALDNVTNPQNIGMIIRTVAASGVSGLIIPKKGCPDLGPLVIKASAGAIFNCPIIYSNTISNFCNMSLKSGFELISLSGKNQLKGITSIAYEKINKDSKKPRVFILGNETKGISKEVEKLIDYNVYIPMNNGVESLNVAIVAALIAFI
tara:strand:+ start:427 stop:1218 length:792 start_codon:yes stop_codon:yes gene_type:complete